jgi:hypothetical protein
MINGKISVCGGGEAILEGVLSYAGHRVGEAKEGDPKSLLRAPEKIGMDSMTIDVREMIARVLVNMDWQTGKNGGGVRVVGPAYI